MPLDDFKKAHNYDLATQILQQYLDIKFAHQDCLVLFRLGDFFELFYDDARNVSRLLGLTLTKRANKENYVEMCGVPYHAINTYIPRLLDAGYKIAICQQLESPEEAKKRGGSKAVVKRQVVRVLTPGTLYEENLLDVAPNYLMSIVAKDKQMAITYLDVSTLEFNVMKVASSDVVAQVMRISPKEILVSQGLSAEIKDALGFADIYFATQADSYFAENKAKRTVEHFTKCSRKAPNLLYGDIRLKRYGLRDRIMPSY